MSDLMLHADEMATVWVLRAGRRDQLVQAFLDDGEVGVEFPAFPDGRTIDRIGALRLLGVGMDDEPTKLQEADVAHFLSFVRRMAVGDLALLLDPSAGGIAVGVVSGDYRYRDDLDPARARHRRPVEWRRRLAFASLPARLEDLPDQRAPIEDVPDGRLRELALRASEGELGDDPFDRPRIPVRAPRTPSTRRPSTPRAPARPPVAVPPTRRCTVCLVTKPESLFDDGEDACRDCA